MRLKKPVSTNLLKILLSAIVFLFLIVFSYNYISKTTCFFPVHIEIEADSIYSPSAVKIFGKTPSNNMICFDEELSRSKWEKTYGIFNSFYMVMPSHEMAHISKIKINTGSSEYFITPKHLKPEIKITHNLLYFRLPVTDERFINFSFVKRAGLVYLRLFSKISLLSTLSLISLILGSVLFFLSKRLGLKKYVTLTILLTISYCLLLVIFVIHKGAIYHPDSASYYNFWDIRPMVYPLYICFMRLIPGAFQAIPFINVLIGIIVSWICAQYLINKYNLNSLFLLIILILLSYPYFDSELITANYLIAESLSYPLFILLCYYIIVMIEKDFNRACMYRFFLILSLLILTRSQFKFIYPVTAFIFLILVIKKHPEKYFFLLSFLASIIFIQIADRSYHKIVNNRFQSTPLGGIVTSGAALYVSQSGDTIGLFGEGKELFKNISTYLDENHFRMKYAESSEGKKLFNHYCNAFDLIIFGNSTINRKNKMEYLNRLIQRNNIFVDKQDKSIKVFVKNKTLFAFDGLFLKADKELLSVIASDSMNKYIFFQFINKNRCFTFYEAKDILFSLALHAIKRNFKNYISLVYNNLKYGNYSKYALTEYLVSFFLMLLCMVLFFLNTKRYTYLYIVLALMLHLSNLTLVSFIVIMRTRYIFYTKVLIILMLTLFGGHILKLITPRKTEDNLNPDH